MSTQQLRLIDRLWNRLTRSCRALKADSSADAAVKEIDRLIADLGILRTKIADPEIADRPLMHEMIAGDVFDEEGGGR